MVRKLKLSQTEVATLSNEARENLIRQQQNSRHIGAQIREVHT
jgi:hypothetical protein